jgi:hypothetical protein
MLPLYCCCPILYCKETDLNAVLYELIVFKITADRPRAVLLIPDVHLRELLDQLLYCATSTESKQFIPIVVQSSPLVGLSRLGLYSVKLLHIFPSFKSFIKPLIA